MNMKRMFLSAVMILASAAIAFADDQTQSGGLLASLVSQYVIPALLLGVTALAAMLGKLLVTWIKNSKYSQLQFLAGLAVKFAEDKLGDGKGDAKFRLASEKLSELTKGRVKADDIEVLVRAAYQSFMTETAVIKNP